MTGRITLIDVDRPDEPLEVEVIGSNPRMLRVAVPNTVVEFDLRRSHEDALFEGTVGARWFSFDPKSLAARKSARVAASGGRAVAARI